MHRWVEFHDGNGFSLHGEAHHEATCIVTELSGWFEGAEVRQERTERLGDGEFPSYMWRKGRDFNLAVLERFETQQQVIDRARAISAVFRSGEPGHGWITADFEGKRLTAVDVGLDKRPRVTQNLDNLSIRYELPLFSTDSYLYGEPVQSQAFVQGTGTGLIFPLFDDADGNTTNKLEFGDEQPPPATLINTGNATAYPVVTVTGDMRSGFILSLSGDKDDSGPWRIAWQSDTRPFSPVTVDFSGSVVVDGVDQSWALTERGWGGVRPGGAVSFTISPIAAGSGSALMTLRPTYL